MQALVCSNFVFNMSTEESLSNEKYHCTSSADERTLRHFFTSISVNS